MVSPIHHAQPQRQRDVDRAAYHETVPVYKMTATGPYGVWVPHAASVAKGGLRTFAASAGWEGVNGENRHSNKPLILALKPPPKLILLTLRKRLADARSFFV